MLNLRCGHSYPPTVKRAGDVGFDIYTPAQHTLPARHAKIIQSGVWVDDLAEGYWLQILTKSGSPKKGFATLAGVVDSAYRGEIGVWLMNLTSEDILLPEGSAIAQGVLRQAFYPAQHVQINGSKLAPTEGDARGADGGLWRG